MTGPVRFQASGIRITDAAIETPGRSIPLEHVLALEERPFVGTYVALVASLLIMAAIGAPLAGGALSRNWIFYAFLVIWGGLVVLLGYSAVALKGLRLRTAAKTIAVGGRFTRADRRRIIAAFAEAKAALPR